MEEIQNIPIDIVLSESLSLQPILSEFLAGQDVRPNSRDTYERQLRRFFAWLRESGRLERGTALRRQDILEYRETLRAEASVYTVNGYLTAVRKFYAWLEAEKALPNICRGLKGLRKPKGHAKDTLTKSQLREACDSINRNTLSGLRDYALFNLMARTGLRDIEVSRACIEDLRQEAGQAVLYIHGKGRDSKDEFVLLTEEALVPLREYLAARKAGEQGPLFSSTANRNSGEAMTTRSISRIVKGILRGIGLDSRRLTAHSLRHTAITLSIEGGASIEQAGAMARHKSIDTTMVYWHNYQRIHNGAEYCVTF